MRRINLGLVVIGAVVALAGCGGGGEEPTAEARRLGGLRRRRKA